MRRALAVLLLIALTACGGPDAPPPDAAVLPAGVFGTGDQDIPAAAYAQNAFADAKNTYGNPEAGAQAVLAMEYIAGELNTAPRWAYLDPGIRYQMLQARAETRAAAGIAPDAPSQLVVDSLNRARNDFASGDTAAAAKALDNPAFPGGGAKAVLALTNLPYIRSANLATQLAVTQMNDPDATDGS